MNEVNYKKKGLIVLTFAVYIGHLALNGLAAKGGPDSALFPTSIRNISRTWQLEMTPAGPTFAIWGLIFTGQLMWLVYALTTVFRSSPSAGILSEKFYIAFILNILCLSGWLFTWARLEGIFSFFLTFASQICLNTAIGYAFSDLKTFLDKNGKAYQKGNADVWVHRILLQNALELYATWTTVATLINMAVVLSYSTGLCTTRIASLVSLSILGVLAVLWFIVENSVLLPYTPYTFCCYVTLIIANLGIVYNIYATDKLVGGLTLGLLILSVAGLITRCTIIIVRSIYGTAKSYNTLDEGNY